jgi:hypothetical protein
MYRYEEVEVFRNVINQCNQGRIVAMNSNGERKVPPAIANSLLEHVNSNFMFTRPRREVYARKNFFPKTRVQEKILYKKPPFTLRNQQKFHQNTPLPAGYSGQGLVQTNHSRVVSQSTPRASYHTAGPQQLPLQYQTVANGQPAVYVQGPQAGQGSDI